MSKAQQEAVDAALRARGVRSGTVAERRAGFEARIQPDDAGALVPADVTLGGRPAIELSPVQPGTTGSGPAGPEAGTLLYLHGGGFVVGSHRTGVKLAAGLAARAGGLRAYSLDYRLAPENPFPAAQLDALAAYRDLLERGTAPDRIVIAGDSAGATLTVQTLILARDAGLPLPAAAVLFSPFTDATASGRSMTTKHGIDPLFTRADLEWFRGQFLGNDPAAALAPLASPALAGDLRGLPPALIQVGSHEVLLDDAVRLAGRFGEADVDATLEIVAGVPHVFQNFTGLLDEADAALDRAGSFLAERIGARAGEPVAA
ncbi:MAG TPA: alpha/beta hydrolase [Trebonia sp.]|jgi:acetyl esterase/lipase|nr:alpha/beta hydrolase [Trebonia sp.]